MKFSWDQYLGSSPALYADKALKKCGLREPPICEMTVADSLGLEVKEIPRQHIREFFGNLGHNAQLACEYLREEVSRSAGRLKEPGIDALDLLLDEVEHRVDLALAGQHLAVVDDTLF